MCNGSGWRRMENRKSSIRTVIYIKYLFFLAELLTIRNRRRLSYFEESGMASGGIK